MLFPLPAIVANATNNRGPRWLRRAPRHAALDIELILTRCRSFVGNACEQVRDTAYEGRKQWCGERIRLYHRGNQCKLRILSAEDLKTTLAPIDDPVLVDAAPGVELELRFAVTLFVGYAPRQHFDDQLGGPMEVPIASECHGHAT